MVVWRIKSFKQRSFTFKSGCEKHIYILNNPKQVDTLP